MKNIIRTTVLIVFLTLNISVFTSCSKEEVITPPELTGTEQQKVFKEFWDLYDRHYALFHRKNINWQNIFNTYNAQITSNTTNEQLLGIFKTIIGTVIKDGHTSLTYNNSQEAGYEPEENENIQNMIRNNTQNKVTIVASSANNPYISYGTLTSNANIGYINSKVFEPQNESEAEFNNFKAAVDAALTALKDKTGIIIDVRTNGGGQAHYAYYLAGRLETLKKGDYTFNGTGFEKYNGMTLKASYANPTNIGEYETTEGVTIKDGKFVITGNLATPTTATWYIEDGEDFVAKGQMVLEPGNWTLTMDEEGKARTEKAPYNFVVYNAWETSGPYKEALKALKEFTATPDLNMKDSITGATYFKLVKTINEIKDNYLKSTFDNSPDPMVKAMVAFEGFLFYDREEDKSGSERLATLEKLLPDHYLVKTMKHYIKVNEEAKKMDATVSVGKIIKNFTAKDHNGKKFNLEKVLKKNKYTLVEFWASWCGPCRGEIPHMKKAYSHYKDKGFEIVSFSLDDKKSKWDKAYNEDGITWIDTSDLMAHKSPVVKMFGVRGVPANFLVDSTGKIIARDLRQEKLDEKLAELLN